MTKDKAHNELQEILRSQIQEAFKDFRRSLAAFGSGDCLLNLEQTAMVIGMSYRTFKRKFNCGLDIPDFPTRIENGARECYLKSEVLSWAKSQRSHRGVKS